MDIVERSKLLMLGMGARPVLWLLVVLSVVSVTIIAERAWLLASVRDDLRGLLEGMGKALRGGDMAAAVRGLERSRSPAAAVALAGLAEADRGHHAAEQAMNGARALERRRLERRLAFLGTLGNNAPFIGLFGTVIGIMEAFQKLGEHSQAAGSAPDVMGGIAEALVATAVGLAVAIPAVAAFNYLQRLIKGFMADADVLSAAILGHLRADASSPTGASGSSRAEG